MDEEGQPGASSSVAAPDHLAAFAAATATTVADGVWRERDRGQVAGGLKRRSQRAAASKAVSYVHGEGELENSSDSDMEGSATRKGGKAKASKPPPQDSSDDDGDEGSGGKGGRNVPSESNVAGVVGHDPMPAAAVPQLPHTQPQQQHPLEEPAPMDVEGRGTATSASSASSADLCALVEQGQGRLTRQGHTWLFPFSEQCARPACWARS